MNNLRRLVGECDDGECPTVFASTNDTFVLQGPIVSEGVRLGAGEQAVEVPVGLIEQALAVWKDGRS